MDCEKKIEIPFGAFDSELIRQEINIPKGFKATIEGDKIILTRTEREDEKVRKALAEMVHDTTGDELWVDYNVHKEEALAWLEKQGESHINHDDEIMIKQLTEYFTTGHGLQNTNETVVTWLNDVKEKLEKQCKQKPPIEMKTPEESLDIDSDTYNEIMDECIYGERKPDADFSDLRTWKYIVNAVWTEKEDIGQYLDSPFTEEVAKKLQKRFGNIAQRPTQEIEPFEAVHGKYYYCIKDYFCGGRKQASKGDVVQALRGLPIMGLKDASEYFLPVNFIKCNSAWSEEDEKMLADACVMLDWYHGNNWWKAQHIKNWLKALKQRCTWKPSDEQMRTLSDVVHKAKRKHDTSVGGYSVYMSLVRLYLDLKKLREEQL